MRDGLSAASLRDLDDAEGLELLDAGSLLRATAGAGAQVRAAMGLAAEAGLDRLADLRPRALLVVGAGSSALAGDVLAAVAGDDAPAPVIVRRDYGLPGWVGAVDAVFGVSRSGHTRQVLTGLDHAAARGASVVGVGAADSPLAEVIGLARGPYVPVAVDGPPRAAWWALTVPLLLAARAAGVLDLTDEGLEAAADRLDTVADQCRVTGETFMNPAKSLALDLAGTMPMVWGTSPLAGVAAHRFAHQLAENAKYPALVGVLPEAGNHQVECLTGVFGGPEPAAAAGDLFADRGEEPQDTRLRLVLLREADDHPAAASRADAVRSLAQSRGVEVTEIVATAPSPMERLVELVGMLDFASLYLGLAHGIDPGPVPAVVDLTASAGE